MKNNIWIILITISISFSTKASQFNSVSGIIISKEIFQVTGRISIEVEYSVFDTIFIKSADKFTCKIRKNIPVFTRDGLPSCKLTKYLPGDKFTAKHTFRYNRFDLPYYPADINLSLEYERGNVKIRDSVITAGKIYFTPYNTVEIWDEGDYFNLKRVWLVEQTPEPKRFLINKNTIPSSNITNSINLDAEPWQDDFNNLIIDGLAYSIPMKRNEAPVSINLDKTGTTVFKHGCGPTLQRFIYTITGKITSDIIKDQVNIGLSRINLGGLELKFYENDLLQSVFSAIDDQYLGSTVTNEDGSFQFHFNICQSIPLEGNNIELYIVVRAENPEYKIKAKTSLGEVSFSNPPKFVRRAILGNFSLPVTGNNIKHVAINGNINDGSHRSVVYCKHAMRFCNNNNVSVQDEFTIWPYFPMGQGSSGFFMPSSLLFVVPNPLNLFTDGKPGIYLSKEATGNENTTYHEFGHYLMWRLQNKNWINPFTASFINYSAFEEENANIAWTEGWADGFMAICDMANYKVDEEFHRDKGTPYETRTNQPDVIRGYKCIYYIATALFDLFDGPDKFSQFGIPFFSSPAFFNYNDGPGAATGYRLERLDNISLSFRQICQPIIDRDLPLVGGGLLHNIDDYFQELIKKYNCILRREIKNAFDSNRISNDAGDTYNTGLSTDIIELEVDDANSVCCKNIFGLSFNLISFNETFLVDVRHNKSSLSYNVARLGSPAMVTLSDDVEFSNNAVLGFNRNVQIGLPGSFPTIIPIPGQITNAELCNGMRAVFLSSGRVQLGENNPNNKANVFINDKSLLDLRQGSTITVNNNSTLVVRSGGTLYFRSGSRIVVNGTGKIIVDPGGYICIEPGVILNFSSQSELRVSPSAIIGVNPVLNLGTTNCVNQLPVCINLTGNNPNLTTSNEALNFDGTDDFVEIADASLLNLGTGDFTLEAFIKSDVISSGGIQTILSKRTFALGSTSDGFLFGIWTDGHLFMQLQGTPNIGFNQGPVVTDGNCHHVAVTRNGTTLAFYVDGVNTFTAQSASDISSIGGSLRIGKNHVSQIPFDGQIGEIRIWNVARTQTQILSSIGGLGIPPHTGLIALYDMTGLTSQNLTDFTGNGHNGRLGSTSGSDGDEPAWITCSQVSCKVQGNFKTGTPIPGMNEPVFPDSIFAAKDIRDITVVSAYPNPFNVETKLVISGPKGYVKIIIRDIQGKELFIKESHPINEDLFWGRDLSCGIYYVQVMSELETKIIKLIKTE